MKTSYNNVIIYVCFLPGEQTYSCPNCGEVFRSKVAVRRHQSYVCSHTVTAYSSLKEQMGLSQHPLFAAATGVPSARNSSINSINSSGHSNGYSMHSENTSNGDDENRR